MANIEFLPEQLFDFLHEGSPALLLTVDVDGYPHTAMTWAVARDTQTIRLGADIGSTTLANLRRSGRASLQVIGPDNLLFLVKGSVRQIKERIEAAAFPIAMMELAVSQVKDQSWGDIVRVAPLSYEWVGDDREQMAAMEQAVPAELLAWEP